MYTSKEKVENKRLGKTLSFHAVPENYQINGKKKTVYVSIQSFASDKVLDAYNDDGMLMPTSVAPVLIENIDINNVEASIKTFMDENLTKIVAL